MNRNRKTISILGQTLLSLTMGTCVPFAQAQLPISYPVWLQIRNDPMAMSQVQSYPALAVPQAAAGTVVGPSMDECHAASDAECDPRQSAAMTDGAVIVYLVTTSMNPFEGTSNWLRLTPDINGNYATGTCSLRCSAGCRTNSRAASASACAVKSTLTPLPAQNIFAS
jgi:hypothetical protein